MVKSFPFSILCFLSLSLFGQSPSFTAPNSICRNQTITLQNTSTGATSYLWDFCHDGLTNAVSANAVFQADASNVPEGIEVANDNGNWFVFYFERSSSHLFRLDFGSDINNSSPSQTDLGNVGSQFSWPTRIRVVKEGSTWYGVVANFLSSKITVVNFGSSLSSPAANITFSDLGAFALSNPRGLDIINSSSGYVIIVSYWASNSSVLLARFSNGLGNSPTNTRTVSTSISNSAGAALVNDNGNWYGLVGGNSDGSVTHLNLGSDPFDNSFTPVSTVLTSLNNTRDLKVVKDGLNYFGLVESAGGLARIDFGADMAYDGAETTTAVGNFNNSITDPMGISLAQSGANWKAFTIDQTSGKIFRIDFQDQCANDGLTFNSLSTESPTNVFFSNPGNYQIDLIAYNSAGGFAITGAPVTVGSLLVPSLNITNDNNCFNQINHFLGTFQDASALANGSWDLGSGNLASGSATSFQFPSVGNYLIQFSATAANGCQNMTQEQVSIFNSPQANFSLPPGMLCTGQAQVFTNTSIYDNGSNPAWTWLVDGAQASNSSNLSQSFTTTGSHDIKLVGSISGCFSEKTTTINLQAGPTVDFSYTHNCFGQSIQFTNATTGTGITTFVWDFGDGNMDASQWNTQHLFAQGDFAIVLTVNNSLGCSNKKTVPISVRNQPLADFSYSNAIENLPTNFLGQDLTLSDDAVNQWTWAINNSQPVNGQSTNYIFPSAGNYSGSLSVQTNQGCSYTVTKTISIVASTVPTIQTAFNTSACLDENINFQNTSVNSSFFTWDFCFEDLRNITGATPLATVPSALVPEGIKTVYDLGIYYAFMTSRDNNKLFRIRLGGDISLADPSDIVDLNISGLSNPTDLRLVKENNVWYALIINLGNGHLFRLRFGNGLANLPDQTSDLGTLGILETGIRGFDLAFDGTNWLASIVNFTNDKIYSLNLGSSLASIGMPSSISFSSSLVKAPTSVALIKDTNGWKALISSLNTNQIVRIDFGSDILSAPLAANVSGIYTVTLPFEIALVKEGLTYDAYVVTSSGELHYLNFGSSVSTSLVESANRGTFGILANGTAIDIVRTSPNWKGLVIDYFNQKITKVYFSSNCSYVSEQTSSLRNPVDFYFGSFGSYPVELTAYHQDGNLVSQQSIINVSNQAAPTLSFSIDNPRCINVSNSFTSQSSENLTHTTWDFGDGTINDGTNTTVSHIFTNTGQKTISLAAKGASGCGNFKSQTISIFNPPTSSFVLPTVSPYCSNQLYTYTNTSTYDNGSNPAWQWSVNGQNVSTTQDLNYLFTSAASQSVSLTASIPGCVSLSTQSVTNLVPGPLIVFDSPSTGCNGSAMTFTNKTIDPVNGFLWSFGDGNTLATPGPSITSNTFTAPGQYQVILSASNAAGCQNSSSKNINIYSNPQPDFAIEAPPLSCERSPAQFDNLTPPLADSNITSWLWSFADAANGSSTQKNPSYIYASANNYNVSLQATSNFGCSTTVHKSITISPSPIASFTYPKACVNQSTIFTNNSQGNLSSQWSVENNLVASVNLSHTFTSSGSYPVSLTVTSVNGCVSRKDSLITVPVQPVLNFSVQAPCTLHPAIFSDMSLGGPDPGVLSNWNFGQGSGIGSTTQFEFASTGVYPVTLTSTRQSGCVYSVSNNVTIYDGPVASFTPSVLAGGAPLTVNFVNNAPADTNVWNFGDHVSTKVNAVSPSYTYNILGAYKVLLTAKNLKGCSDTTSTIIDVVIPHIDIVMNSFSLTSDPNSNFSKPVISVLNSGNIPLVNPEVLIDLGGGVLLKGQIPGMVKPGKSVVETLDMQIVPQTIQYVCAEIEVADDVNSSNNKQCISLTSEDVLMNPYPNPSNTGQVSLQWVGAVQETVRITIYKSNGDIAFSQNLDAVQSGLGQLTINTSSFANGLYLIQFAGSKMTKTFRIVIAN